MNKFSILIKWAIRFTFISILWSYLEKILGYHDEKIHSQLSFSLIFGIVYVIIYYLTLSEIFSKVYNNKIAYKSAFMNLAALTLFIAFLSPFTHLVMHNYISPNYFENAIQLSKNKTEQGLEIAKNFYTLKSFIFQGIQNAFSIGIILAAIIPVLFINRIKKNEAINDNQPIKSTKKLKKKYQ